VSMRGGQPTILISTSSVEPLLAAFSPDGQRIAYTVQNANRQNGPGEDLDTAVFTAGVDGGSIEQVTDWGNAGSIDRMIASWSPDGSQLAFSGAFEDADDTPSSIFVVKADGTDLHRIASPENPGRNYSYAAWR